MMDQIKEHRVPVAVTVMALLVAVVFGIMPARENASQADARVSKAAGEKVAALEERVLALEAALAPAGGVSDTPPTREEVTLIVKGLINQTGRVSRLQDQVEGITEGRVAVADNPRIVTEISLIKRGLVNLTRRINAMGDTLDTTAALPQVVDRLNLRMSNAENAVTQLHRRIRSLQAGSAAPGDENLDGVATQLEEILLLLQASR